MQQEFDIGKDNKTDMLYKVYRAVGGAANRQVAEMLDDGLAVRLRRRALAKRSAAGLVCTAAAVAIIMTAAYKLPLGSDIEKTDKSVYSSPAENVSSAEREEAAEQVKSADNAEFGDEERAEQNAQENGGTYSDEQEQTDQSAKPDNSTETDTKKDTAADDVDPADESSRTSSGSGKPTSSKGSTTAGSDPNEPTGGGPPLGWNNDLSGLPYGIMNRDQWHMIVEGYYTVEMNAIKALPPEMTH